MNIDVREYLRVNPISVHELSLSDNSTDCFLFFPNNSTQRGYRASTQKELFRALQMSILGNLLNYTSDPPKIKGTTDTSATISDDQFKNYVRRSVVEKFMSIFDDKLQTLKQDLDEIILTLRRKGILDYDGAVELQSARTRSIAWTPDMVKGVKLTGPLYNTMSYAEGLAWCKGNSSDIPTVGGKDNVELDVPIGHDHYNTRAEALTGPLVRNFGGGQLVGNITVGSQNLLTQDTGYGPSKGESVKPLEHTTIGQLTYPLWGENVLDWRTPNKTHNNVPPSLNIYIRYKSKLAQSQTSYNMQFDMGDANQRPANIIEAQTTQDSAAEAQYTSSMVCELDEYTAENLTPHDYILRITHEMGSQVKLMKQGLQMLLDIFATKTNSELSTNEGTMQELLMKHLDRILMPKSEFLQWYVQKIDALNQIESKLKVAQGLVVSVPPLNYVGRIVISYTDDTEQKVIANYGGKSWRRIENFVRGVRKDDPDNIPGQKLGEDYVELRESNVPVHTHSETLPAGKEPETKSQEWAAKQKSGRTIQPVNTPVQNEDSIRSVDVQPTQLNYQISPLEYKNREANEITLPHDNLPPYLKVYIWECTELTKEEMLITGEPDNNTDNNLCIVTWLRNNGQKPIEQTREIGTTIENAPEVSRTNYDFKGWKCPDGRIADEKQDGTIGQPVYIGDTISGNSFYIAQWKPTKHTVTFHGNGGIPAKMTREYEHGQKLGYLPTLDEIPLQATGMVGWFTSAANGSKVSEDTTVTSDMELLARWKTK